MDERSLTLLADQLRMAGVAPKHIRRVTRELRDHTEDLVKQLKLDGMTAHDAALEASKRLGSVDTVRAAVLARPELLALSRRKPGVVFALFPVLICILLSIACLAMLIELFSLDQLWSATTRSEMLNAFQRTTDFVQHVLISWCVPALITTFFASLAARRNLRSWWTVIGIALVAELSVVASVSFDKTTGSLTTNVNLDLPSLLSWRAVALSTVSILLYFAMLKLYAKSSQRLSSTSHDTGPLT